MTVVGVELLHDRVRAVARPSRGRPSVHEVAWTPESPETVVSALRAEIGPVRAVHLAVGIGFLHVQGVSLPPASAEDRQRMVALDPDRWFAVASGVPLAVGVAVGGDVAFAAEATAIERWVEAFGAWARVDSVMPAPLVLGQLLVKEAVRSGVFALESRPDEHGVLVMEEGALARVRRGRADMVPPGQPAPARDGLPAEAAVAFAAATGGTWPLAEQLLTAPLAEAVRRRTRRAVRLAAAAAVAAWAVALWSLDASRARRLAALDAQVEAARVAAEPGFRQLAALQALDLESEAIARTLASRVDVAELLATLGARLPTDAMAQRLRITGRDVELEGNAATAAAVLAALAAEPRFERVRFLAPSLQYRDGGTKRETYAVAFAVR